MSDRAGRAEALYFVSYLERVCGCGAVRPYITLIRHHVVITLWIMPFEITALSYVYVIASDC